MTEKQINKWLRRQFSPTGWVLIGYYVLMNLLLYVAMAADLGKQLLWNLRLGSFPFDFDWNMIWSNGWGYVASCVVALLIIFGWKGSSFWSRVLKTRQKRMTFLTLLAVIGLSILAQLLNSIWIGLLEWVCSFFGHSMMPLLESVSGATDTASMFLYSAIFAPVAEEILFRGYILHTLKPYGKRFAILGSGLLFGIFHGNLLQMPYAVIMGFVLGYLAVEHSFLWAVFLHVFNNLVLAEGLSRLAELLPPIAADVITMAVFAVFSLAALGILIAKRGEIREYRAGEWIDRRCVKCLFTNLGVVLLLIMMAGNIVSSFYM